MSLCRNSVPAAGAAVPPAAGNTPLPWYRRLVVPNPIVQREVLSFMRLRSVRATSLVLPLLFGLLAFTLTPIRPGAFGASAEAGRVLLMVATTSALYFMSLVGAVLGAQSMTSERQGRTLELVTITGIPLRKIVLGKALASWVALAVLFCCGLPVLGLCFVTGGVSLAQILVGAAVPLAVSVLPISIGLCLATVQRSARLAVGASVLLVGLLGPGVFSSSWAGILYVVGQDPWGSSNGFFLPWLEGETWPMVVGWVLLPAFLIGAPSSFLLACATTALCPFGTDRARPLRWWLLVAGPLGGFLAGLIGHVRAVEPAGAMTLLGLAALPLYVGTSALSGHSPARHSLLDSVGAPPGQPSRSARWRQSPVREAAAASLGSALALVLAVGLLLAPGGAVVMTAGGLIFAFLFFLSGSSLFLSSLLKPQLTRGAVMALGAVTILLPLTAWLFASVTPDNKTSEAAWLVGELSPLGALITLGACEFMTPRSLTVATWTIPGWGVLGLLVWTAGLARLFAPLRRKRNSSCPP